jgi:hypothetical protein
VGGGLPADSDYRSPGSRPGRRGPSQARHQGCSRTAGQLEVGRGPDSDPGTVVTTAAEAAVGLWAKAGGGLVGGPGRLDSEASASGRRTSS